MHCVTCPAKHVMTSTERKEGMRISYRDASGSMSIDRSERGGERMRDGESLHRIHKGFTQIHHRLPLLVLACFPTFAFVWKEEPCATPYDHAGRL